MDSVRVCVSSEWADSGFEVGPRYVPLPAATAISEAFVNASPAYTYRVTTITNGRVERRYANDADAVYQSGDFTPGRDNLADVYDRYGYGVIANADGWFDDSLINSQQIKGGVVLREFSDPTSKWGTDSLGFRADGSWKVYSARFGDTTADVVADGVVTCVGFGPALVIDGVAQDIEGNAQWSTPGNDWTAEDAARQIVGVRATGEIVLITVAGTDEADAEGDGIHGDEMPAVALRHGCRDAIMLDGGGSAQLMLDGALVHPSSDAGGTRAVPGFLCVRADVTAL